MYKYKIGQISITDFGQPAGMHLNENNRWVKKAAMIPWGEIEKRYAKLFKNNIGNVAKPLRLELGACMIQAEYGYYDEEITLQIQETAYLQYFCGYEAYDDSKLPFDSSSMVYFRKRLTPEILGEINERILIKNKADATSNDDHNSGTMIVDTTFHCIAMSVVVLNLRKLMLSLLLFFKIWLVWIDQERLAVLNGGSFQKICAFGVFAPFLAEFKRCYGDLTAESIYKLRYRAIAA